MIRSYTIPSLIRHRARFTVTLLLLVSMAFFSCHKDHPAPASGACQLSGAQVVNGSVIENFTFSYNSNNQLSVLKYSDNNSSYTRTFTYGDKLIVVTTTGASPGIDSVFLDAAGKVSSIASHHSLNTLLTFTRDNSGYVTQSTLSSPNNTPIVTDFHYQNGDLQEMDLGSASFTYVYFTDKASTIADLQAFSQWIQYGIVYFGNRHVTRSVAVGGVTQETLEYSYDANGKPTSVTVSSGGTSYTTQYTYDCH